MTFNYIPKKLETMSSHACDFTFMNELVNNKIIVSCNFIFFKF